MRIYQVDAFTDRPFAGNPAAVCLLDGPRDDAWQQLLAREMNLSETAFLLARPDGSFDLRWFTPRVEVELCGHATLASAHALWEGGHLPAGAAAVFHTKSGILRAVRAGDGWIELDFPALPGTAVPPPPGLIEALGVEPAAVEKSKFDYLVEVAEEAAVRALRPDFAALAAVEARGVIVTSRSAAAGVDFVSRFFAPAIGVDEDPVTGSAHCRLGPYWQKRLGKDSFLAYQASERGGTLRVRVEGDRVTLAGRAATIFRGDLLT